MLPTKLSQPPHCSVKYSLTLGLIILTDQQDQTQALDGRQLNKFCRPCLCVLALCNRPEYLHTGYRYIENLTGDFSFHYFWTPDIEKGEETSSSAVPQCKECCNVSCWCWEMLSVLLLPTYCKLLAGSLLHQNRLTTFRKEINAFSYKE